MHNIYNLIKLNMSFFLNENLNKSNISDLEEGELSDSNINKQEILKLIV